MIGNLLKLAQTLIPKVKFKYRKFNGIVTNEFGQTVPSFGDWIEVEGMQSPGMVSAFGGKNQEEIQYEMKVLGIDPSKRTITIWLSGVELVATHNQNGSDQILYDNSIFNIIHTENWLEYNGWKRCYCQEELASVGNGE